MLAGEVSTSAAEESFPERKDPGEKAVITFAAMQFRSRFGFIYPHDDGQVWLTTRRLVYRGGRGEVAVPLGAAADCGVLDMGPSIAPMVQIRGRDGSDLFRFSMDSGPLEFDIDGLALQLRWDEQTFVELFESLRRP